MFVCSNFSAFTKPLQAVGLQGGHIGKTPRERGIRAGRPAQRLTPTRAVPHFRNQETVSRRSDILPPTPKLRTVLAIKIFHLQAGIVFPGPRSGVEKGCRSQSVALYLFGIHFRVRRKKGFFHSASQIQPQGFGNIRLLRYLPGLTDAAPGSKKISNPSSQGLHPRAHDGSKTDIKQGIRHAVISLNRLLTSIDERLRQNSACNASRKPDFCSRRSTSGASRRLPQQRKRPGFAYCRNKSGSKVDWIQRGSAKSRDQRKRHVRSWRA